MRCTRASTVKEHTVSCVKRTYEGGGATVATMEGANAVDTAVIARFGLTTGKVIQEFGYDDDVDEALRSAIAQATAEELVDEDFGDVTDGVLL